MLLLEAKMLPKVATRLLIHNVAENNLKNKV
jgi:hypothetical protein